MKAYPKSFCLSGGGAVVRLELSCTEKRSVFDQKFVEFGRSGCGVTAFRNALERLMIRLRHGDVAGQIVVGHPAIGAALDVRMTAQGVESTAGPPDVAEQQLEHRGRVNELDGVAVMRPPQRVHDRAGAIGVQSR